jgi:hypothetical protein
VIETPLSVVWFVAAVYRRIADFERTEGRA